MKRRSLKLWHRVVIVALTSTVPLLVITSVLISDSISKDKKFTEQEIRGNAFLRPLEQALEALPRHLAAARAVSAGEAGAPARLTAAQGEIDAALGALVVNFHGDLGRALNFSDAALGARRREHARLSTVLADWDALQVSSPAEAATGERTRRLVAAVRTLITHAGDQSNLILDPDLDSFYLMDVALVALPQTQQRLGEIILQTGGWLRLGQRDTHRSDISVQAVLLRQDDQDRIVRDAQIALDEDEHFHGVSASLQANLPPAIEKYRAANQAVIDLLTRVAAGDEVAAADLEAAGWTARAESFRLWETAVRELDRLLEIRVAAYRHTELLDFLAIALTIGLTVLVVWLVGTEIDITGQKESEAKLRQMRDYLVSIIDSMPAAIVAMDRSLRVTQWNRHAATLSGVPAGAALGQTVQALLPDFATAIESLRAKTRPGGVASQENFSRVRDSERQVFDLMLYHLAANDREGSVLRIEDVTERVRMQEMLVQTEKMMSLGGLAAGMAHEINNPLGIISQASQNLERRIQPDLPANQKVAAEIGLSLPLMKTYFERRDIPTFTHDIREAVNRAAKIINNMLQFGRKSGSEPQPSSLAELLDRTVELAANDYDLRKHYDFRGVTLVREYAPDVPDVPVVVVEIQQVLLNLLKNAAQAMVEQPAGRTPTLTLRLRCEGGFAVLEIADNGPGMEAKVARRVFEPFFTTKRPGVGTGLGLSVSYMIVTQNHGGLISVAAAPGHGCTFTVKLPLHRPATS